MPLRTVGLVAALCLLAGWLMGSLVLPPVARLQSNSAVAQPVEPVPPPAPAYADRLRTKLREAPPAPQSKRNPFLFEAVRPPAPTRTREVDADPPATIEQRAPTFDLAGIATSDGVDGIVRTAVLSTRGDVVLARVGDMLADGSRVVSIDDASVTLDVAGQPLVLRLK